MIDGMLAPVLHIAEIGLRVSDLPKMAAFYQEHLGLEIVLAEPNYIFFRVGELPSPLGAVGHPQMLVLFDREVALDVALGTLDHLAFEIASERYAAARERLQARGMLVRERAWPDSLAWRARSRFFRDPEGDTIELIAHDPGAQWGFGRTVGRAGDRPTGGADGVLRLAHAWHERVMADEVVSHAFEHGVHPQHTERLAAYWGEAWGGPPTYSQQYGTESDVVRLHSGNGPHEEMDRRSIGCFERAMDDVGLDDSRLRRTLLDDFTWATTTTLAAYPTDADAVPEGLRMPRWSWDGLRRGS